MNVELIVDSTVDVPEHIRSRLTVVPLTIHFGQEEYLRSEEHTSELQSQR